MNTIKFIVYILTPSVTREEANLAAVLGSILAWSKDTLQDIEALIENILVVMETALWKELALRKASVERDIKEPIFIMKVSVTCENSGSCKEHAVTVNPLVYEHLRKSFRDNYDELREALRQIICAQLVEVMCTIR